MDESPALALRNKKDSSMRVAINLVKQGEAQACVSAGNTGALMGIARFVLKMLPGVDRPAMISALPTTVGKPVYVLDLGANIESTSKHLVEYAIMGSIVAQASMANGERPKVALLNIGSEDIKGTSVIKEASQMLNELKVVNYIGYIEANDLFQAKADVIVCDGFVGNVALKMCEGTARFILRGIKQGFKKNLLTKFCQLFMLPVIGPIKKRIDPSRYNGASLLGLNGIVIKSHGNTSIAGYMTAIEEAILEIEKNIPEQISHRVEEVLKKDGDEE
jgi:glycerol-3-phosphate acyltransferase PlsX